MNVDRDLVDNGGVPKRDRSRPCNEQHQQPGQQRFHPRRPSPAFECVQRLRSDLDDRESRIRFREHLRPGTVAFVAAAASAVQPVAVPASDGPDREPAPDGGSATDLAGRQQLPHAAFRPVPASIADRKRRAARGITRRSSGPGNKPGSASLARRPGRAGSRTRSSPSSSRRRLQQLRPGDRRDDRRQLQSAAAALLVDLERSLQRRQRPRQLQSCESNAGSERAASRPESAERTEFREGSRGAIFGWRGFPPFQFPNSCHNDINSWMSAGSSGRRARREVNRLRDHSPKKEICESLASFFSGLCPRCRCSTIPALVSIRLEMESRRARVFSAPEGTEVPIHVPLSFVPHRDDIRPRGPLGSRSRSLRPL